MRPVWCILTVAGLTLAGFCADRPENPLPENPPQNVALLPCGSGQPGAAACAPSPKELKEARTAFARGLKLENAKRTSEALNAFETAARLVPRNPEYVTAHEITRQQVVFERLQHGNAALAQGLQVEALADFRGALEVDPQNEFAQQRLRDALGEWAPKSSAALRIVDDEGVLRLSPSPLLADIHYRGDGRGLLTQVANIFGISATFDESVVTRPVRFDIGQADFYTAMRTACEMTRTFWTPLDSKQLLLAAESSENHKNFDHMALRTFLVPGLTTPTDLGNIANLLHSVFEIRMATPQPATGTLVVRAPQNLLDAATQFLETLDDSRPQVMLDIEVYEVNHMLTRNLGLQIPNQFKLFNIPAAALAALGGQNIQDLINQLISGGGINQANNQAISALLAQLQGQQNSIFSQPLATFGGGKTFSGVSLGTLGAQLSLNETWVKNLEHATLRTSQGDSATFRLGSRYPILNASFAPIFNSPAISQVLQNNSFQAPFPSFNYEDLGLSLKAKPFVNGASDVSLQLELQFRNLLGQSINGVPVISNREFVGSLALKNGEPAIVAGSVSRSETRSLTGIPGMGAVPGLNKLMTSNSKQEEQDELLILITPRVISRGEGEDSVVWIAK
jgi:general secretion pathway protein D